MAVTSTETLNFEKVWAMFQETREQMKESFQKSREEFDRGMKETREEMKKADMELKEQMKETDRQISRLGNRFGELAEHLVAPNIKEKFRALGYKFEQVSLDHNISDENGRCLAEIDILLENGDIAMVVEVKAKPRENDVDDHVNRIEILRQRADARNDRRKFQGAIAGAIMSDSVRNYAHKAGFYVIEQTGDTVKINKPDGFIPREW
ncbi:MAG: hypothetical protein FWG99_10610 [Treponema sp.]|nr:hypothetical protein [Treponema sp.]